MFILFDSVRRPGVALRSPGGVDSSILIVDCLRVSLTGLDTSIVLSLLLLISSSLFDLVTKNSSCLVFALVFEPAIWLAFTWQLKDRLSSRGRHTIYRFFSFLISVHFISRVSGTLRQCRSRTSHKIVNAASVLDRGHQPSESRHEAGLVRKRWCNNGEEGESSLAGPSHL